MRARRSSYAIVMSLALAGVLTGGVAPASSAGGVTFVGIDSTTRGDRCVVERSYGEFAYALPLSGGDERPIGGNDPAEPGRVPLDETGGPGFDGPGPDLVAYSVHGPTATEDRRALESPDQTTRRATAHTASSFVVTLQLPPGDYRVAPYIVDFDANGRVQTTVAGTGAGSDSATTTDSVQGAYERFLVHTDDGQVSLSFSGVTPNAVVSGIFVDPASGPVVGIAHEGSDLTTRGDWVGAYGATGFALLGFTGPAGGVHPWVPSHDLTGGALAGAYSSTGGVFAWTAPYAQQAATGPAYAFSWTGWLDGATGDPRAQRYFENHPELAGPPAFGDRRASTWDAGNDLAINADEPDRPLVVDLHTPATAPAFDLALYFLDWDGAGRSQDVTLTQLGAGGGVLDGPRVVNNFAGGVYLVYRVPAGADLQLEVRRITGTNVVLGGLFLDEATGGPFGFVAEDRVTRSAADVVCAYGNYAYVLANAGGDHEYPVGGNEASEPATASQDETGGPGFDAPGGPTVSYAVHGPVNHADDRALLHPDTNRRRATAGFGNQVITRLDLPAGTWNLSFYAVDFDRNGRIQTSVVEKGVDSASHTITNFQNGVYERFAVTTNGSTPVLVKVHIDGGPNAVFSGIFVDAASGPDVAGVSYLGADWSTRGNWPGVYGAAGYALIGMDHPYTGAVADWAPDLDVNGGILDESNSTPVAARPYRMTTGQLWAWSPYYAAAPVIENAYAYAWSGWMDAATGDPRAQRFFKYNPGLAGPDPLGQRRAATWDSGEDVRHVPRPLIVDLAVPSSGAAAYRLSVYVVDYDASNRTQEVRIVDDATNTVLDSRVIGPAEGFMGGLYLTWEVPAGADLRIETRALNGSINSVIGGVFLDEIHG